MAPQQFAHTRELLRRIPKTATVGVEVGVGTGTNARSLLANLHDLHLYLVDPWIDQIEPERYSNLCRYVNLEMDDWRDMLLTVQEKLQGFYGRYSIVQMESVLAANAFPDRYLDFAFLDAHRSFAGVLEDLHAWDSKANMLCGRGYLQCKAKKAVDTYAAENGYRVTLGKGNTWFYTRT